MTTSFRRRSSPNVCYSPAKGKILEGNIEKIIVSTIRFEKLVYFGKMFKLMGEERRLARAIAFRVKSTYGRLIVDCNVSISVLNRGKVKKYI